MSAGLAGYAEDDDGMVLREGTLGYGFGVGGGVVAIKLKQDVQRCSVGEHEDVVPVGPSPRACGIASVSACPDFVLRRGPLR
jgi:hypothetical protein